jgi:hypothetical protein
VILLEDHIDAIKKITWTRNFFFLQIYNLLYKLSNKQIWNKRRKTTYILLSPHQSECKKRDMKVTNR